MAGLVKAKKYDWKDSNVALIGTDEDRKVKKEAAETEPAWEGVINITQPCVRIWRVNKFKLEQVPKEEHGQFFTGDSYVILKIKKENDTLCYDVFFWIGKYSTQDEYGTAAYKTVELDTLLDDKAIQHREVQGKETKSFLSMFPTYTLCKGGHDTGFRKVIPETYKTRLLQVSIMDRRCTVVEIPCKAGNFDSGDVFILDLGSEIIQWNGKDSKALERSKASQYIQQLKSERTKHTRSSVVDETDSSSHSQLLSTLPSGTSKEKATEKPMEKSIHRVTDSSGALEVEKIAEGDISKEMLTEDDVFFVQGTSCLFVYIGSSCSIEEKRNAMTQAHKFLTSTGNMIQPIVCLTSGQNSKEFNEAF